MNESILSSAKVSVGLQAWVTLLPYGDIFLN